MKKKGSLWLADWRTPDGKRHRKGFSNKKAAAAHQLQQQRKATAKKARRQP
jgi:hypothetical protein